MKENTVKRTLREGGTALGAFVFEFSTTGIARIVSAAGADFIVFDMEHTGWSIDTIRTLLSTVPPELVPFVRVPAAEYHFVARVLDLGAAGCMVPMVETEEQARTLVEAATYPPAGRRGAAFGIAHDDYQSGDPAKKIQWANQQRLTIAQIETTRGLTNVDRIAAVEGLDMLWVGQSDLTNSMGIPGQFQHPDYLAALDRVSHAAADNGKHAGFMAMNPDEALALHQCGYRCLCYGGDLWLFQQALRTGLNRIRSGLQS